MSGFSKNVTYFVMNLSSIQEAMDFFLNNGIKT